MPDGVVIIILIGVVAGLLSGMFGIGGGTIIVPSLMVFLGLEQTLANGTSLAALLLPVGIFACIAYYREGKLIIRLAVLLALGLIIGTWFGAGFALDMDPAVLQLSYSLFLFYIAWRYMAPIKWYNDWKGNKEETVKEDTDVQVLGPKILGGMVFIGFCAGILSGMFGIGGGALIVPMLMVFLRFDQKLAQGISLGSLLLPVGISGVIQYNQAGDVDFMIAGIIAVMLATFAFIGAKLALSLPTKIVKRSFGIFIFLIGIRFFTWAIALIMAGS